MRKNNFVIKIIGFLIIEYLFSCARYYFFIRATHVWGPQSDLLIIVKIFLLFLTAFLLLNNKIDEGCKIAWLIGGVSMLSILAWVFYFYVSSILSTSFVLLSSIHFLVNCLLFGVLWKVSRNSGDTRREFRGHTT